MHIEAADSAPTELQIWVRFVRRCLNRRVPADKFMVLTADLRKKLASSQPGKRQIDKTRKESIIIQQRNICNALLLEDQQDSWTRDPLIPEYLDVLLCGNHTLKPTNVLTRLLTCRRRRLQQDSITASSSAPPDSNEHSQEQQGWTTASADELVLGTVAKAISTGHGGVTTLGDAKRLLTALTEWMSALNAENAEMLINSQAQQGAPAAAADALLVRESLGLTLLASLSDMPFTSALASKQLQETVRVFCQALATFAPVLGETHLQLAQNLDNMCKSHAAALSDKDESGNGLLNGESIDVGELQLNNVMDLAHTNSRAGTFVYLEAFLLGDVPVQSDNFIMSFLQTRYKGDYQVAATDIITAAFDVLSIGLHTHVQTYATTATTTTTPSWPKLFVTRCFIVNRLPLLLSALIQIYFVDAEFVITQALGRLDAAQFHSFDAQGFGAGTDGATGNGDRAGANSGAILSDTRTEFLAACALHGLIHETSIDRITGETTMHTMAAGGRKTRSGLLSEWNSNGQKTDALLQGVVAMDGNAGAYVGAMTQIYHNLCTAKDTSSLKTLCVQLCRKTSIIDAVSLFTDWRSLLRPLCEMLNTWKAEDDQGEYQPLYDEFSSCLLLVTACVHHLQLSYADLGLGDAKDSFVHQLLHRGSVSIPQSDMTPDQIRQLGGWARALYETEGISDELMSQCSPQDFYSLVPTLIHHSILACQRGKLTSDALASGLELLREAFLIPSLIFAMSWLGQRVWEQRSDTMICVFVLSKFINPPSLGGDAQVMHEIVMGIVGRETLERLRRLQAQSDACSSDGQTQSSQKPDFKLLISRLEQQCQGDGDNAALATVNEVRQWTSGHNGGTTMPLRNSLSMLCFWSSSAGMTLAPLPAYTGRQLGAVVQLHGAQAVVAAIIEAARTQSESGMGDVVLDVATAMLTTHMLALGLHGGTGDGGLPVTASEPCILTRTMRQAEGALTLRDALMLELQGARKTIASDPLRAETVVRLSRRLEAYAIAAPGVGQDVAAGGGGGGTTATANGGGGSSGGGVGSSAAGGDEAAAAGLADASMLDTMDLGGASGMVDLTGAGGEQHDGIHTNFDLNAATGGNNALGLDLDTALGVDSAAGGGEGDLGMGGTATGGTTGDGGGDDGDALVNLGSAADDDIFAGLGDLDFQI